MNLNNMCFQAWASEHKEEAWGGKDCGNCGQHCRSHSHYSLQGTSSSHHPPTPHPGSNHSFKPDTQLDSGLCLHAWQLPWLVRLDAPSGLSRYPSPFITTKLRRKKQFCVNNSLWINKELEMDLNKHGSRQLKMNELNWEGFGITLTCPTFYWDYQHSLHGRFQCWSSTQPGSRSPHSPSSSGLSSSWPSQPSRKPTPRGGKSIQEGSSAPSSMLYFHKLINISSIFFFSRYLTISASVKFLP